MSDDDIRDKEAKILAMSKDGLITLPTEFVNELFMQIRELKNCLKVYTGTLK